MFREALMVRGVTDPAAVERAITALGLNEGRDLDRATAERYAALVVEHHAADLAADDNPLPTPDADLGRRGEQKVHLDALHSPNEWFNAAIRGDRRTLDPHRFFRPE